LVVLLALAVMLILIRTVKGDFNRYKLLESQFDIDYNLYDEHGWRLLQGDVFRRPPHLSVLCALIGTGSQFLSLFFGVFVAELLYGQFYHDQQSVVNSALELFILSSIILGYCSGKTFEFYSGKNWIGTCLITFLAWPLVLASTGMVINTLAILYQSSKAVPFYSMLFLFGIWILVNFPLTILGYSFGRKSAVSSATTSKTNPIPRQIPFRPRFLNRWVLASMGGLMPFVVIFMELYYIMSALWSDSIYYVFGFFLGLSLVLMFVTACSSIVVTCIEKI
jgi:transmembrane 9 superfamily protein 3